MLSQKRKTVDIYIISIFKNINMLSMSIRLYIVSLFCVITLSNCQNKNNTSSVKDEASIVKEKLKALIIDGQNNHGVWPKTTMMMKSYLEETTLFEVAVYRTKYTYQGPHHGEVDGYNHDSIKRLLENYKLEDYKVHIPSDSIIADPDFHPDFSKYDVVISNFGMDSSDWTTEVKASFEDYMQNGGGLVVVHAANNSFGNWDAFNEMIGVGGWGHRDLNKGKRIYYDGSGKGLIIPANGEETSHGPETEFVLTSRAPEHPIMKGLPREWKHTKDELYDRLRGPAKNVTVLATSFSDIEGNAQPWAPENKGSGKHEPLLMTIDYGKGRIFHTALGHMDYSMESVGFIVTFTRGSQWAATGNVSIKVPTDFPNKETSSKRAWRLK